MHSDLNDLERHGYHVLPADSRTDLLRTSESFRPDVILLDLSTPGSDRRDTLAKLKNDERTEIDGFGVVEWFRSQDRLRHVPVVVYSATVPTDQDKERIRLGPTEFMTKSRVPPDEFDRRVVELLAAIVAASVEVQSGVRQ